MFNWAWFSATATELLMMMITAVSIYGILLLCVRLAGLRSFSKMSSFDFAITIAIGTIIAATLLTEDPPLLQGAMGLLILFSIQFVVSWLRRHTSFMSQLVDNQPLLLMAGPKVLSANLDRARLTTSDLNNHLRQAGIIHPEQVRAVVMETTGDISVLEVNDDFDLEPSLLQDVSDVDKLFENL